MTLSDIPNLVINLPERPDRLELVRKELSGWNYTIVPGVNHANPIKGIAQAHINCILLAQQNEWENVLIIEDDVQLRKGAVEYLNKALSDLPERWDILLGGLYNSKAIIPYNEYWGSVGEFCGAHFYIVNKSGFQRFFEYNGRQHIDRWINLKGDKLKCFVLQKFIATQRNGFSDNVKKTVDYSDKIKKYQLL